MTINKSTARFLKRRAGVFLLAVFLFFSFFRLSVPVNAEQSGRRNFLRTSHNPEYYSLFEINGDTLYARGRYADDRIKRLYFWGEERSGSYKMSVKSDGSYEAELSIPSGYYYTSICIELSSGASFGYRIDCDNGNYFPENGLSAENRKVFDNITNASPESVGYYISPTAEAGEIESVLEQIQLISDSVTDGLTDSYEIARTLSSYVAEHFYYDHDARNTSVTEETVSLAQVLRTSKTVCTGFADLYCALLQAQGIDAVNIKGGSTSDTIEYENLTDGIQNHEFTAFYYEKEERWVWVDSCWNGSGDYKNGEYLEDEPHEKYFDISDEALSLDHRADYAQRRSFFEAVPSPSTEILTENTEAVSEPPETSVTEKPLTTTEAFEEEENTVPAPKKEDNTVLIIIVSVLGLAVIGTGAFIIFSNKKVNMPEDGLLYGKDLKKMVVIELENGKEIKIELYPDIAPITVENFEKLVNDGFYNGLTFHRVISGFMIQGGCPIGNGTGNAGTHIKGEFLVNGVVNNLKHTRGVLSMARAADPNSASCQFFIMHEDAPHLDGSYAAFGKVVEGIEVVDEIASVETDYSDKPLVPVVMKTVKIV